MDVKNVIAGAAVLVIGAGISTYSVVNYDLGTFRQMGRGMFPAGVGLVMVLCGALILIPALFRGGGQMPRVGVRAAIAVTAAMSLMAATVRPFGLAPAIFLMTVVSSFADTKLGIFAAMVLGVILSLACYLVFGLLLNMTITFFNWPF